MEPPPDPGSGLAAIAALDQPLRRELYRHLLDRGTWTSRDDAAAAAGVPRSVAAFHLDKLVDAGVLEVHFERTGGRSGPGAGRTSKLYRPRRVEIAASIPTRHYELAGSLLATAVAESSRNGEPVVDCLHVAARTAGQQLGHDAGDANEARSTRRDDPRRRLVEFLARHGYEPEVGREEIALANCPFHQLADGHRELVCGMNLDFLDGVIDGMGAADQLTARLDPAPGHCCVRIT
jgi:predicted ArsR family transcriptional regulator